MVSAIRSIRHLLVTQFFGAFNDNAWKLAVTFLAIRSSGLEPDSAEGLQSTSQLMTTLTFCVLTVPLIVFSLPAGMLADRISKRSVIVSMKIVEAVLMISAATVLWIVPESYVLPLIVLGLMGAQSAVFSPAKYGILPELVPHEKLSDGNAHLEMWTFLAIILGTGTGGMLLDLSGDQAWLVGALLFVLALLGLWAALGIPRVQAARSQGNFKASIQGAWRAILGQRILKLAVAGSVFYWSVATLLGQDVLVYAKSVLGLSDTLSGMPLALFGLGVGAGSLLAARLSRGKVEYGLIPLGALIFSASTFLLALVSPGLAGLLVFMAVMGASSGFLVVPLNALIQWRAPSHWRGGVIALSNVFVFSGVLAGSLSAALLTALSFGPQGVMFFASAALLAGTLWALWLLPEAALRLLLVLAANTVYRIRVRQSRNIPQQGGVLLAPNHVSFVDALVLTAAVDRPIRFIVEQDYYDKPLFKPFMKALGAIPISARSGPRAVLKSLRKAGDCLDEGQVVCIFPEGQITRTGGLLPFRAGVQRLARRRDAVIVPAYLDGLWGSIFSFEGGRVFFKLPKKLRYPATVAFGSPLPPQTSVEEIRDAVQNLGSQVWEERSRKACPLHVGFRRQVRRHPLRKVMADSQRKMPGFKVLSGALVLARLLRTDWRGRKHVGILLPASLAGGLANLAASFSGRVAVNLNFTSGTSIMDSACRQARLTSLVTSRRFLEQSGMTPPASLKLVLLEDLLEEAGLWLRLRCLLAGFLLPISWLERWCGASGMIEAQDTVAVIFSSGSTGQPKGVMLSHFNIDSNIEGVHQTLRVDDDDRVLSMLPFFHSFGYLLFWFGATRGIPLVFHPSPLDAVGIGRLVLAHRLTIMLATPTFLQLYLKRCTPGQFGSLRLVVTGAEKLPPQTSLAFEERFGLTPLEGYGCTECSPVVATGVPAFRAPGYFQPGSRRGFVGRPIPGVALRIIDPDTRKPLPAGQSGLLLVKGPNVMQGYLGRPGLTAEVIDAQGWYSTGDIARIGQGGFLQITDRLSRFSKIGGEMVPHGKIEQALHEALGSEMRVFAVTAVEDEAGGERLAVLHTCEESEIGGLLKALKEKGMPNLFIPQQRYFLKVDEIPLLGSGKVDLKSVKRLAAERFCTAG
ncbi:MAG TPA: acyl-[ACP]--phospholipid O-acyltransferase [Acidobacteriota bacterium]|nr:acyl-[ACP]--phospholipid O-acyltransferase [Acidobacteriota bacterium]